jgi:transcriptional regulatory protein LevR
MDLMLQKNLQEDLYLSSLDINSIDINTIESKTAEEVKMRKLTQKEKKTYQVSEETLKKIESTQENVVWQDQRGNITYDPEKGTIASR